MLCPATLSESLPTTTDNSQNSANNNDTTIRVDSEYIDETNSNLAPANSSDAPTTTPIDTSTPAAAFETTTISTDATSSPTKISVTSGEDYHAETQGGLKSDRNEDINKGDGASNPLNDHDYCSPNKKSKQLNKKSIMDSVNTDLKNDLEVGTMPCSDQTIGKTSGYKAALKHSAASSLGHHRTIPLSNQSFANHDESSSSSSLSSSVTSGKELVIAQDSFVKSRKSIQEAKNVHKRKYVHKLGKETHSAHEDSIQSTSGRARRARQSTSVTDKSEWIMGDDQIDSVLSEHLEPEEKRHKSHDLSGPNEYTSSDYSSSDAGSDQGSDDDSEDDPNRLWCVCRKPHDGKFMICCDACLDWFHGHCVGVTKLMGDRFEKQGKEWFCSECQEKMRAGIPRSAIPRKIVKKEKKKKSTNKVQIPGKRGRGRPRKSESAAAGPTRVSQRNIKKLSSSLDPKHGVDNGRLRKNLARGSDLRSESFDEFEDSQRLKELIKERKKEFFYKRALAEQQKAARRNELGLGRPPVIANLSDSLDSLASSTNTPNMNNLPINIKSEHKPEKPKPNIVLQINTKKEIVSAIVRSPKKHKNSDSSKPIVNDIFTAEPIQISKKSKPATTVSDGSSNVEGSVRKHSDLMSKDEKHGDSALPKKKKRKDSESSTPNGSAVTGGSYHIAQKIKDSLLARKDQIKDIEVSLEKIETLATEIESQLNECFKEGTQKYLNKFRSLLFNLRDPKNQGLVKNVLAGDITPSRLVRMSSDEMASHELAKWRERENKHSIELIKRDAQLAAQQVIVKKTHKGEEVISAPSLDEEQAVEAINQEIPTTPTKAGSTSREAHHGDVSGKPQEASPSSSSVTLKMKISGLLSKDTTMKQSCDSVNSTSPSAAEDSTLFLDSTKDHKNHMFDLNCKICTKQQPETKSQEESSKEDSATANDSERLVSEVVTEPVTTEQPKRLRISIDTKLDPANLSRLSVPLIRPSQTPQSAEDLKSPNQNSPNDYGDKEEGELADNEDVSTPHLDPVPRHTPSHSLDTASKKSEKSWSGLITMPDVAKFSATSKSISGVADDIIKELQSSLTVCGRIAPDQVQSYIKKLRSTSKNQITIIQLSPLTFDDKHGFETFFDYLYSRNRYGVIQTNAFLKDFYVLPVHEKSSIPEFLKPIHGAKIDKTEKNCLLGLLVRSKRTSTSSYTPS